MAVATKTEADAPEEAPKPKVASGKVVRYIGTADVREIDALSWMNVGVEDQDLVVWSKSNKFQVPAADLTKDAVKYCDEGDPAFVVVDADA